MPHYRKTPSALCLLLAFAVLPACKERKPRRVTPTKPSPTAEAERIRPEVEALVAKGQFMEAIRLIDGAVSENAPGARKPLLEHIQAAAAKAEETRGIAIDALIREGKLEEAEKAILAGRQELPTTFSGIRFADQQRRLARATAKANDPSWAQEFRELVDPGVLSRYGKAGWQMVRRQVRRFFTVPAERETALRLLASSGAPPRLIGAAIALERPQPAPPEKQRVVLRRSFTVSKKVLLRRDDVEGTVEMPYFLVVPPFGERARVPLLIELHAPRTKEAHVREVAEHAFPMMDSPGVGPYAYVAPIGWEAYGWWGGALDAVPMLLEEVARQLPIDRDRVYLTGVDAGAGGCWQLALERPSPWAAIGPTASPFGAGWGMLIPNLRHTSIFSVHSENDPVFPSKDIRGATNAVKALGNPAVRYVQLEGDHHGGDPGEVIEKKMRWLFSRRRVRQPDRVTCRAVGPTPRRFYWVRTTKYDPARKADLHTRTSPLGTGHERRFVAPAELDVRYNGNRVEVAFADGVTEFELLLSPEQFDFNKPIVVMQGPHLLLKQRIKPDARRQMQLALDYPGLNFAAALTVKPRQTHWSDRYSSHLPAAELEKALGDTPRDRFVQLLADLERVLHGPTLDEAALGRVVELAPSDPVLRAALTIARRPVRTPPGKHEVPLKLPSHPMKYYMYMPKLAPGQRVPLTVDLHGGGGIGPHVIQMLDVFRHIGKDVGTPVVGVMPLSATPLGWGPSEPGLRQIHAVIRDVCRRAPIDTSRIYLAGFSMGAFGSWMAALEDPSVLAAIQPTGGRFRPFMTPLLPNLRHLGIYIAHQDGDPIVPVAGARLAAKALKELKHPGFVYKEVKGNQHAGLPPRDGHAMMRWIYARRRNPTPRVIVARCHAPRTLRRYHLLVTGYDEGRATGIARMANVRGQLEETWFRKPAGVTLTYRGGNVFEVSDVDGVTRIEVLLDSRMVALDQPVVVRLGDRELFRGKVPVTLATRLRLARTYFDADYRAAVPVDLTK